MAGLWQDASCGNSVGGGGGSSGSSGSAGSSGSGGRGGGLVPLANAYSAPQHWGITVRRTSSTGGWEHGSVTTPVARSASMGAQAKAAASAEVAAASAGAAGCRMLQELELYHCPQVG